MKKVLVSLVMLALIFFIFRKETKEITTAIPQTHKVADLPVKIVDQSRIPSSIKETNEELNLGNPKEKKQSLVDSPIDTIDLPGLPSGYALSALSGPPMAVNLSQNQSYPISSVIKLTNISEAKRQELIAQGFGEHYYHPDLKIFYLEATAETVITAHKELLQEGYSSHLEVQRHFHKPK